MSDNTVAFKSDGKKFFVGATLVLVRWDVTTCLELDLHRPLWSIFQLAWVNMKQWRMVIDRENQRPSRKILFQCHFLHKSHMDWDEREPVDVTRCAECHTNISLLVSGFKNYVPLCKSSNLIRRVHLKYRLRAIYVWFLENVKNCWELTSRTSDCCFGFSECPTYHSKFQLPQSHRNGTAVCQECQNKGPEKFYLSPKWINRKGKYIWWRLWQLSHIPLSVSCSCVSFPLFDPFATSFLCTQLLKDVC